VKETAPNVRTVITNKKNERENIATDGKKGESNMEMEKKSVTTSWTKDFAQEILPL
jgi:hypothetical protein